MRVHIDVTPAVNIAYGKDHVFGYFVQVYTNGQHDVAECECLQCECDMPAFEGDNLGSWHGVDGFTREKIGVSIMGDIVGVGEKAVITDTATYDRAVN